MPYEAMVDGYIALYKRLLTDREIAAHPQSAALPPRWRISSMPSRACCVGLPAAATACTSW